MTPSLKVLTLIGIGAVVLLDGFILLQMVFASPKQSQTARMPDLGMQSPTVLLYQSPNPPTMWPPPITPTWWVPQPLPGTTPCLNLPAVTAPLPTQQPQPPVENFDPCTRQTTLGKNALKRTGGPYISQTQAEQMVVGNRHPIKVRSFFTSNARAEQMMGNHSISTMIYPDREIWLVVVQFNDPNLIEQHLAPGIPTPTPLPPGTRFYIFSYIDATSGQWLGGGQDTSYPWPPGVPQ